MPSSPALGPVRRAERVPPWSRDRAHVAHHLIGISRELEGRVMRTLEEDGGFTGLRLSIGPLLSLVWKEGRSPTALAGELAISSQACGQLIDVTERAGYLERRPNPDDRRSKLVTLTRRGEALVAEGVRVLLEIESVCSAIVGAADYRAFTTSLASLYRGLGIPTHADPVLMARAGRSIGVLPLIAVRIQQQLMEATIARGHPGLLMSHGQVLPHVGPDGARVAEIARLRGVSRQAIFATSRDLERKGYLRREPDRRDRRGVVLRLTRRGERLLEDALGSLDDLDRSLGGVLGRQRLRQLERVAAELHGALIADAGPQAAPNGTRAAAGGGEGSDILALAARLRRELGRQDSARLAALLVSDREGRPT